MIEKVKIKGYRIFKDFEIHPSEGYNLIVGANESGKSTLIEALTLALTGRINGRWAAEELNPHWFNLDIVDDYLTKKQAGEPASLPTISIEVFLKDSAELQQLCGANNSDVPTNACPGLVLQALPSQEYREELDEWSKNPIQLLPVEYYTIDWRTFADKILTSRPRQLVIATIDSRTVRSTRGVDYHMRQILQDELNSEERARISLTYREIKASMSEQVLKKVNDRIAKTHAALHDQPISLAMDQTARTSWEGAVTPHVNNIPFAMSGQGQQAAIKISLAMNRQSTRSSVVMIEEPENHLSFSNLSILLSRMESLAGENQQLFVSTHSSFVLNRLGIDKIHLLSKTRSMKLSGLTPNTVAYFKKLPGHDTLRMALVEKIVLVEGPSDEIVFERFFKDLYGKRPLDFGIDVLSVRGLSFSRCLELCSALDTKVAVLRDNDNKNLDDLRAPLEPWLKQDEREIFIGTPGAGTTLEPQLLYHNDEENLRKVLSLSESTDLSKWMSREKTECALRIAEAKDSLLPPAYIKNAAQFIHE